MSEPNALEVSLDTLQFKVTQREDVTSAVTLRHPGLTDQDLAFKVRERRGARWHALLPLAFTSTRNFRSKPPTLASTWSAQTRGILAPGSSTTVSILLKDKDRQALWSTFDRLAN